MRALLGLREVFDEALRASAQLRALITEWLERLTAEGALATASTLTR